MRQVSGRRRDAGECGRASAAAGVWTKAGASHPGYKRQGRGERGWGGIRKGAAAAAGGRGTLTLQLALTRMLAGFKSRWITPAECMCFSPCRTW